MSLSRRQALCGIGAVVTTSAATSVFASEDAQAASVSFSMGSSPKTLEQDQNVTGASLAALVDIQWDSSHNPTEYVVSLFAGTNKADTKIDSTRESTTQRTGEDSLTLQGDLTDLDGVSLRDFEPSGAGEKATKEIYGKVVFELINDGTTIATSKASDSATATVSSEGVEVSSQISGSGSVNIEIS